MNSRGLAPSDAQGSWNVWKVHEDGELRIAWRKTIIGSVTIPGDGNGQRSSPTNFKVVGADHTPSAHEEDPFVTRNDTVTLDDWHCLVSLVSRFPPHSSD